MMPFDVVRLRQEFPLLRDPKLHYLDNAATSQVPETILTALQQFDRQHRANVHGGAHRLAKAAIADYEAARHMIARYLNAESEKELVFTYGTTSSINLVAQSFGELLDPGDEIVLSVLEHHSNLIPWQALAKRRGIVLRFLPVNPDGRLELESLGALVGARCRLIAVTHSSNVTGAITDVEPIVRAAQRVGARVLLDGAQRIPHAPVDVQALGVDFYAFSGHKMYGPTGIGGLWARENLLAEMPPFLVGGQMIDHVTLEKATFADPPQRFEAGTPPIAGAVGLGAAVEWMARQDWQGIRVEQRRLTGRILERLEVIRGVEILGPRNLQNRGGVVSFHIPGVSPKAVCQILDDKGVCLRFGHHCAQPLLQALGVQGALRASLAPYNDDGDVDALLNGLEDALQELEGSSAAVTEGF